MVMAQYQDEKTTNLAALLAFQSLTCFAKPSKHIGQKTVKTVGIQYSKTCGPYAINGCLYVGKLEINIAMHQPE